MNESGISKHDQILAGLVMSLQAATMQHLGKIQNPLTGKIDRDLDQARGSIDLLEMLKAKCRTDTPAEILSLLDTAVMELQMNYLDEVKKGEAESDGENGVADAATGPQNDAGADDEPGVDEETGADEENEANE